MSKAGITNTIKKLEAELNEILENKKRFKEFRDLAEEQTTIYTLSKKGIVGHLAYQVLALYTKGYIDISESQAKQIEDSKGKTGVLKPSAIKGIVKTIDSVGNDIFNRLNNEFDKLSKLGSNTPNDTIVRKIKSSASSQSAGVFSYEFKAKEGKSPNIYKFIYRVSKPLIQNALNPLLSIAKGSIIGETKEGKQYLKPGRFFQIGHMFNSTAAVMGTMQSIIELAEKRWPKDPKDDTNKHPEIVKLRKKITESSNQNTVELKNTYKKKKLNLNYKRRMVLDNKIYAVHSVLVELQASGFNASIGTLEKKALDKIRTEVLGYLAENFSEFEGSPTIGKATAYHVLENTIDALEVSLGRKPRFNKPKRKAQGSAKGSVKKSAKRTGLGAKPKLNSIPAPRDGGIADVTNNLVLLKNIINEHLPDYIQKNMGKGNAKEILNYRTGRFAKSAELRTLAQVKGSKSFVLDGLVTYMRNPYDVFRPGGKLHKPGRDPKRIIDKSIRQILKEKALIALSFKSQVG